jgi:hypothetical protein
MRPVSLSNPLVIGVCKVLFSSVAEEAVVVLGDAPNCRYHEDHCCLELYNIHVLFYICT